MDSLDGRFLTFLAVSALLIVTPGPDMALVTRNAFRSGRRAASLTACGVAAGIFVWAVASTLGVAVLFEGSATAFTVLKFAGAAYLAYLGLRSLTGSFGPDPAVGRTEPVPRANELADSTALRQGLFGNLLNPKAGVIFVSIIPQFIRPGDAPIRMVLMIFAFEAMLLLWLNIYGWLMSRAGRSRAGHRVRRIMERVTGVVLIGLGLRVAFEQR